MAAAAGGADCLEIEQTSYDGEGYITTRGIAADEVIPGGPTASTRQQPA